MWQVTTPELRSLGFSMIGGSKLSLLDPPAALHINTLEFIALTVNVWLALSFCMWADPSCSQDHIGNFLADNMTALSWMCHAGHTHLINWLISSRLYSAFPLCLFNFSHTTSWVCQTPQPISSCILHVPDCGHPLLHATCRISFSAGLTSCHASPCLHCMTTSTTMIPWQHPPEK